MVNRKNTLPVVLNGKVVILNEIDGHLFPLCLFVLLNPVPHLTLMSKTYDLRVALQSKANRGALKNQVQHLDRVWCCDGKTLRTIET
jgi:hypothetical protein